VIEQALAAKFESAKSTFADRWRLGMDDWFKKFSPGHMVVMQLAEQNLDVAWIDARRGDVEAMSKFDDALAAWKNAHVVAVDEFYAKNVGVTI
jgi:hypothetical protein